MTLTITSGNAVFSGGDTQKQITMTIVDDESLVLTLSNSPEYLLVEEEIGQVIVHYSLAKPISSPVSFTAALANGVHSGFYIQIAEKGHDYVDLENSTITIPPGETRGSIPISIIDDSDTEYSQGFTIRLTNPTNSVFACSVTDINTVCNENLAEFFVRIDSNDFITASFEHEEYFIKEVDGGTTFDFKVLFSDLSNASFTSRYTIETTDGTARYRTDFNYPGSFISRQRIRSDERMRTHSMTINYNANYTGNKSFTLSLIRPLNLSFPEDAVADQQVTARYSRKITIIDAQAPPINITTTDFTVDEDVTGGNLVVNYAIDNPATRQISFNYDLIDGTAEKGLDYTEEANRTATIPIGSSTGSFSIPIREDDLREGNETFTLVLSNLVGASLFNDNALTFSRTVTIIDDDPPTLSIANTPLTVLENVGAGGLVVEAMLSGTRDDFDDSTNLDVTFSYTLADDSATEGTDYTQPTSRTLRIPEGETSTTFMIPIIDDAANPVAEGPETFDIVLTISDGAIFEGGGMTKTETVTIQDNDPPTLTFQTNPITGFESTGTAEIPVRVNMSAASYQDVTFNYSMNDGSARKGLDYLEEVKREVTLFTGETRGTFSIPVIDDLLNEGNETFTIILSNPTNAEFADEEETISKDATIVDNEPPRLSVTTTELTVDENVGSDGFQFTVRLSGATRQVVSFKYDLTDDTATEGQDYTEEAESDRTIMIPIGDTEVTFKIPILNDSTSEGNEQFGIMLSGLTGAVFASGQDTYANTIVIRDDELPFLSIANTQLYVGEDIGSSGYNLELELLGTIRQDVSVSYAIIGGSAVAGTDFNSSAQTVVFDADRNETSKMIPIEIIDNDDTDGDKTIQFRLSQLSGAIFAGEVNRLVRTIVIVDDEPTTFAVTTTNFRVDEDVAAGQIDINYTLTPASTYDVTFDVFTQNDTALHGLDYGGITKKTVTITAGSTSGTISIPILDDEDPEGEESFTLNIEDVVGAVISGDVEAIVQPITIVDDEAQTIFFDDILSAENIIEGYGNYTMRLSTPTAVSSPINIRYSSTTISATSGTDYTAPANQSISIASGADNVSLSGFNIPNNAARDGDKTFRINLSITSGSAVFLGGETQKQITMTIIDDESLVVTMTQSPSAAPLPTVVDEDVGNVFVNYSLARAISSPVTFEVVLTDGVAGFSHAGQDATIGEDVATLQNTTITIPPGETSGSVAITIVDDAIAEIEEGFTVTLNSLTNAVFEICNPSLLTCTPKQESFYFYISENDKPTVSFTNSDFTVVEASGGTHFETDLMLSAIAPNNVVFDFELIDGTAKRNTDYTPIASFGGITKNSRNLVGGALRIPISYNSNYTGNKTFSIRVKHRVGSTYTVNFPSEYSEMVNGELVYTRTITIVDREAPEIRIT